MLNKRTKCKKLFLAISANLALNYPMQYIYFFNALEIDVFFVMYLMSSQLFLGGLGSVKNYNQIKENQINTV